MIIYADENIEEAIIQGLRRRGVDVISARELGYMGRDDEFHLLKAKQLRAVVFTHDIDFLIMAHRWSSSGREHNGIVYVSSQKIPIGVCIRRV